MTPAGVTVGGHVPAIGGFCWQQTGIPRVGTAGADPSLNVDPRNGIEPDITFTGAHDSVPWVVWYEKDNTAIGGLHNNEMVLLAVGNVLQGALDTTGAHGFGACAASASNEAQCSLNKAPGRDAEDPQLAAGTMNPANPTVPAAGPSGKSSATAIRGRPGGVCAASMKPCS